MFAAISEKTGWTPQEIASLTTKQISHYVKAWNRLGGKGEESNTEGPDFNEIQAFNLASGIERISKKK